MVNMKNMLLGVILAGFMFLAVFSFADTWTGEFNKHIDPELIGISDSINDTLYTMYGQTQADSKVIEESKVYSGSTDIGIISAEPFKVLKSSIKLTKLALNMTRQITSIGIVPDWVGTLALAAFLLTMTFLALNAIFKTKV